MSLAGRADSVCHAGKEFFEKNAVTQGEVIVNVEVEFFVNIEVAVQVPTFKICSD